MGLYVCYSAAVAKRLVNNLFVSIIEESTVGMDEAELMERGEVDTLEVMNAPLLLAEIVKPVYNELIYNEYGP